MAQEILKGQQCRMASHTEPQLLFYTTEHCHLCEQAESLLVEVANSTSRQFDVEAVDIAFDEILVARYGELIPVLRRTQDGAELSWPFSAQDLSVFLQAIPE